MGKTKQSRTSPTPTQAPLYYKLHTLLETIRVIKVYEDPLCTLLHAIQTAGKASPEIEQELHSLLDEMPAEAYALELHGIRSQLTDGLPATGHAAEKNQPSLSGKAQGPAKRANRKRVAGSE